jgi:hypothetical protein
MSPRQRFLPALLVTLSVLLLAGCGRQGFHPTAAVSPERDVAPSLAARSSPADPGTPTSGRASFFPLEVGNHWHYAQLLAVNILLNDSTQTGWIELRSAKDARLVRTQTIGQHEYVVEEDVIRDEGEAEPITQYIFWRQDRTGLFEAEVPGAAAARAAGAPRGATVTPLARVWSRLESGLGDPRSREAFRAARGGIEQKLALIEGALRSPRQPLRGDPWVAELTRLHYPLHPNAQWDIRTDMFFAAQVEGKEALALPAGRFSGWRIRYSLELFGPRDRVHVWYGRDGYLSLVAYLEQEAIDYQGNRIGTAIVKVSERLDGIELVGH